MQIPVGFNFGYRFIGNPATATDDWTGPMQKGLVYRENSRPGTHAAYVIVLDDGTLVDDHYEHPALRVNIMGRKQRVTLNAREVHRKLFEGGWEVQDLLPEEFKKARWDLREVIETACPDLTLTRHI